MGAVEDRTIGPKKEKRRPLFIMYSRMMLEKYRREVIFFRERVKE